MASQDAPRNGKLLSIHVLSETGAKDDRAANFVKAHTTGVIAVTSVAGMVDAIKAECVKDGSKIMALRIDGHGNNEGMEIGSDFLSLGTYHNYRRKLAELAPYFHPSATVTLGGCGIGQDEKLLQTLSATLGGVAVRGMTSSQIPIYPGDEGGVRTCRLQICDYTGKRLGDYLWP